MWSPGTLHHRVECFCIQNMTKWPLFRYSSPSSRRGWAGAVSCSSFGCYYAKCGNRNNRGKRLSIELFPSSHHMYNDIAWPYLTHTNVRTGSPNSRVIVYNSLTIWVYILIFADVFLPSCLAGTAVSACRRGQLVHKVYLEGMFYRERGHLFRFPNGNRKIPVFFF